LHERVFSCICPILQYLPVFIDASALERRACVCIGLRLGFARSQRNQSAPAFSKDASATTKTNTNNKHWIFPPACDLFARLKCASSRAHRMSPSQSPSLRPSDVFSISAFAPRPALPSISIASRVKRSLRVFVRRPVLIPSQGFVLDSFKCMG
jgi:hypothetical protein